MKGAPIRLSAVLVCLLNGSMAMAAGSGVTVGTFTAEQTCTTYELKWGREFAASSSSAAAAGATSIDGSGAASGYIAGSNSSSVYAREWGADLRRECVQNFPQLRSTIIAALASAGPIASSGQSLTLSGRLTDVGYDAQTVGTQRSMVTDQFMVVTIEFQLRDRSGRVVYGGALTKRLNISTGTETADISYSRSQTGGTTFSQIQQQVGFAVARAVIFHLQPLRVVENDGKAIALNYGTPLVPLGSAVIVTGSGSLRGKRLTVTSSMPGRAIAESDARISLADIAPGTLVMFAEADDAAAKSRVFERVDLPEN